MHWNREGSACFCGGRFLLHLPDNLTLGYLALLGGHDWPHPCGSFSFFLLYDFCSIFHSLPFRFALFPLLFLRLLFTLGNHHRVCSGWIHWGGSTSSSEPKDAS
jgi:hypothetical protein